MAAQPIFFEPRVKREPRVYEPFRVRVRGRDRAGEPFKMVSALDNISGGGLYVRLPYQVPVGARLSVAVHFTTSSFANYQGVARMCALAVVLRSEAMIDGGCGIAVAFTRHRFL